MSKLWVLAILATVLSMAEVAFAAPTEIGSCTVISSPGEYVLNQTIADDRQIPKDAGTDIFCINITSSDVILDGSGYTIKANGNYTADGSRDPPWGYGYGIFVYNSTAKLTNVTIKNVKVNNWLYGIYFNNTENSTVYDTTFSNIVNIHLAFSTNISIVNNTGFVPAHYGISLYKSHNNTLTNNTMTGFGGWYTKYGSTGYLIEDSENNTLLDNTANYLVYGMQLISANGNYLENNTANYNKYGIYLWNSDANTFTGNTANYNGENGFTVLSSDNNTFTDNTANYNGKYGMYFESSSGNILTDNTAFGNSLNGFYPTPMITIVSPMNQTYDSTSIELNVSANENVSSWKYTLDGNTTDFIPNTTIGNLSNGQHELIVSANDTSGNTGSATVYFTIGTSQPTTTTTTTTTTTMPGSTTTTTTPPSGGGSSWKPGGGSGIYIPLEAEFSFTNPPSEIFAAINEMTEFDLSVTNTGNKRTSAKFSFSGAPAEWFSSYPENINLTAGETITFKIKIQPKEIGNYSLNISLSGDKEYKELPLTLIVGTQKPTTTTTTTTRPLTTTTTLPAGGITGAILFVTSNPGLVVGVILVCLIGGSVLWVFRKEVAEILFTEEAAAEEQKSSKK